eukprot:FR741803.1.p1 GENE.FR741803.1~~FR741803.1.p1  ORF type:complete len:138 (-),score=11.86 FR741803.1:230-643(-)
MVAADFLLLCSLPADHRPKESHALDLWTMNVTCANVLRGGMHVLRGGIQGVLPVASGATSPPPLHLARFEGPILSQRTTGACLCGRLVAAPWPTPSPSCVVRKFELKRGPPHQFRSRFNRLRLLTIIAGITAGDPSA